ncbi:Crp/Fnr family transcriptional regulator [Prolixibacter sp. NT017]|uniref:Crp/Fnr family transcriptional regulator n=1 Tax=Prolixibacter sp. NT017 TaxID=2652390 RepID=UPI00127DF8A8|nr:Crp/Fnr family transcriptional regulator [Prolixibacter sp. NT017]GET25491.1 cyclic nucleotide-binding protein [Prolixibacter sp. NT017]
MKELIRFINQYQELDPETEEAIQNAFVKETYRKNEFLLEEGKVCSKICFISSGLVRRFSINDGVELTKWLYYDTHWVASLFSYFRQEPSVEFLQACEETIIYSLSYKNEQKLLKHPLFLAFHVKFLRISIAAFDEFHFVFGSMSAQAKYRYILEKFPLMIQKAKQKHIASLMNVSQETLSRIRASIN